jgi:Peptidase of plants and bacteria
VYRQIPLPEATLSSKENAPVRPARKPKLRLEVRDLSSTGARSFLSLIECGSVLEEAVDGVLELLYTPLSILPGTRSVTLIIRNFDGVAHTVGSDLDDDHKEIHLSTSYIEKVPPERRRHEILGVLRHEMVHCWQWNAKGTCPGGLIEGIADFVRLRDNLAPPHWKRAWKDCEWDSGYERTAYFLDYLERRFGYGTIIRINERLRDVIYHEKDFWAHCCGVGIDALWSQYCDSCEKELNNTKSKVNGGAS